MDTKHVKRWYFNSIPLHTTQFTKFLSNAHELGHKDIQKYVSTSQRYVFPETRAIGSIPSWFFSDVYDNLLNDEKRAVQTALWNHAILLNKMLHPFAEKRHVTCLETPLSHDITLMQYVYRLYANQAISKYFSSFNLFTTLANKFMFTPQSLKYAVENMSKETIGDVLEHYNNPELRQDIAAIMGKDVTDVLDKILACSVGNKLIDLGMELYKVLFPPNDPPESDQNSGSPEQEQSSEEWLEEHQDIASQEQPFSAESCPTSEELDHALENLNQAMLPGWDKTSSVDTLDVMDVLDAGRIPGKSITESDVFAHLGRLLRQIKITKELPYDPQHIGSVVLEDELYRLPIDRRIMGEYEEIKLPVKKEWRIVCDLSGSTAGILLRKELAAAKGAFISLRDARENVQIYGHTTYAGGITLYKIADTTSSNVDQRFNMATGVYNGSNFDNRIIHYIAANEFHYHDSMKIILMLSDGKPCGVTGVEDTTLIVNQLRKKGYIIFSVSLVGSVMENNDIIYGKKWNINASNGNIDNKLKDLFIKMTMEFH